jgi:hypothetical protein
MKRASCICAAILLFVSLALAADFWNSKPVNKWSASEATRLLTDSPWAHMVTMRTGTRTGRGVQAIADAQVEPQINYTVYLRSAKPIRQAKMRMAAFDKKYDKMDDATRKDFDAKWGQYVDTDSPDKILVMVAYGSNVPDTDRQLALYFQNQTLETVASTTSLTTPDGKHVDAIGYRVGQGNSREFQLEFPRSADMPAQGSFVVEFKHPDVPDQPSRRISTKFSLKDMQYSGALVY